MSSTVCLDIAIDHRICRLIKPSTNEKIQSDSAHILQLEELFRSLGDKDPCEFVTTADLAGPERKGGILVALERPANNHPFSDGTDVVVEGSPSLRALKDIFSLFDLSLVRDVSVIDAFPFLPKGNLGPVGTDSYKATSDLHFTYFLGAVVAKQPDVVLCMWKSPESPELKSFNCELQSKGIGQWFQQPKLIYSEMSGDQIDLVRVNAFHPSFALTFHPEYSCFRQLLVLEVAHAYGLWKGNWNEEAWMVQLRNRCREKSSQIRNIPGCPTSSSLRSTYATSLSHIFLSIMDFVSVPRGERRLKSLPYAKLTSNNLVEPFNDCTLCLTEIDKRMNTKTGNLTGSPEVYSDITFRTMGFVLNMISMVNPSLALELDGQKDSLLSLKCTEAMRKTAEIAGESWYRNKGFKTIIIELLVRLGNCFTRAKNEESHILGARHLVLSFSQASQAFLDTAKAVESLLNDFVESGSTIA